MSEISQIKPVNILDDICQLTTIPTASMQKLFDKVGFCITNAVYEAFLNNQPIVELNLGIGNILVSLESNQLVYKFIPGTKLEKNIIESIRNNKNPLDIQLESTFANRILRTYKDLM